MSYAAAGLALLSLFQGYMGAKAARAGALAKADEYDLLAYETDLTKKFNWKQRNQATTQLKLQTLQSGVDKAAMAGVRGHKVVEGMRSDIGGSGVALGSGTPTEVLINQHLQNANTQLSIMQGTQERLSSIHNNAVAVNKMEDWKANMRIRQLRRAASSARSGADASFFAGMIGAFTTAGTTYKSSGGEWDLNGFRDDPNSGWYDTWGSSTIETGGSLTSNYGTGGRSGYS
jgi:hypothetical protein